MVKLFAVKTLSVEGFQKLIPLLPPDKHIEELLARSRNLLVIQHNILGYLLMRKVLHAEYRVNPCEVKIVTNEHSKPSLSGMPGLHFNISHSGDWVVSAFSEKPVGIDIEKIKRVNLQVAHRFFSSPEIGFLNEVMENERDLWFLKLWTIKESYLKALGTGLSRSMSSFVASYADGGFQIRDDENPDEVFLAHSNFEENYLLSVSAFEPHIQDGVKTIDAINLIV